jgi:F420-0:gamma-glutamyl ligase-like protein
LELDINKVINRSGAEYVVLGQYRSCLPVSKPEIAVAIGELLTFLRKLSVKNLSVLGT